MLDFGEGIKQPSALHQTDGTSPPLTAYYEEGDGGRCELRWFLRGKLAGTVDNAERLAALFDQAGGPPRNSR